MNEVMTNNETNIENMIYEIRGRQVMLDSDLAKLYNVETKRINEAVSRNKEKFPERFCFKISESEYNALKSQFATSKGGARKGHWAFVEQGIVMLATVLRSHFAIQVSIRIMDAFVAMRHYIGNNLLEQRHINDLVLEHDNEIKELKESFKKFDEKKKINDIYYNGQIFDAYSKIYEIFNMAKKELIVIDNYADISLLDIIKKLNTKVIIITKKNNLLTEEDINKYNKQYHNLKVIFNETFHDRYFIIDKKQVYHCGASINRIGYKTFSINLISDEKTYLPFIDKINKIMVK